MIRQTKAAGIGRLIDRLTVDKLWRDQLLLVFLAAGYSSPLSTSQVDTGMGAI